MGADAALYACDGGHGAVGARSEVYAPFLEYIIEYCIVVVLSHLPQVLRRELLFYIVLYFHYSIV